MYICNLSLNLCIIKVLYCHSLLKMKNFKYIVFLALALVLASCSNKEESLLRVIPADASGVVAINTQSVLAKCEMLNQDGNFELPQSLKSIVDENDASQLCQILTDIPVLGLDLTSKAYVFFTVKTFGSVFLASVDDEDAARKAIERRSGGDFQSLDGLDCIFVEETFYTVYDKILFIGHVNKPMEIAKAASAARKMLGRMATNITDDNDVMACLQAENDINAFLTQNGLNIMLNRSSQYREITKKFPLFEIFTESDIQAYICSINLNSDKADLDIKIKVDDNSEYLKLLSTTLNSANSDFLKAIPESMDYIVAMSVNGMNFVNLPQIKSLISVFSNIPFIGKLDLAGMLSTIDGPVAAGLAHDPNIDEWNVVFAAKSNNQSAVLGYIKKFASALGQHPQVSDGEYIYEYDNRMINIGVKEGILYVKILNYEQTEGYAYENKEALELFTKSAIGAYGRAQGGHFSLGLIDNTSIHGSFAPDAKDQNAAVALVKVLCSVEPPHAFDNVDEGAYMPAAIDQIKPVNTK